MGRYISFPILLLAATLQTSILPLFRIYVGQPSLVYLFVFAWSIHAPLSDTLIWALVGGLFQDLLSSAPLGTTSLSLLPILIIVEMIRSQLYHMHIVLIIILMVMGSVLQLGIYMLVLILTGTGIPIIAATRFIIIPTLLYNLILFLPIYVIIRSMQRRFYRPTIQV